ncbi:amidase [Phytohabitans kaempferiae]|uniref:Amidase n=1 Tax=Phytohabitans kaempferiae TaxID=1620943 RepID=A0ABV6MGX3_9ACTN
MSTQYLDATATARLVHDGTATPVEILDECIKRIESTNPQINAVIVPLFEKARAEAETVPRDAPFAGVPYVLKDLTVHSKGDPYSGGIRGLKSAGYRSDHDSHFVRRMREAGFVLVGKANTPEMGMYASTEPLAWGPTRNPWDVTRSVGGSSGGSAAAVAAGMVPIAHGNDGGGSIRMPSSFCGVVGLKPTRGRVSSGPLIAESDNVSGKATEGLHTLSIRDAAAVLDLISGHHAGDPYWAPTPRRSFATEVDADPGRLRIGVMADDPSGKTHADPEAVAATMKVAEVLAELGHDVAEGHPEILGSGTYNELWFQSVGVIIARELDRLAGLIGREFTEDDVEPATWGYMQQGRKVGGIAYAAGVDALREQAREMERWWEEDGWDLLLTPTVPVGAPQLGQLAATAENPGASVTRSLVQNLQMFNVSGQPALSLPLVQRRDGMPQGVQLAAAYGREDVLIRVARQLEVAMPWMDRRPPHGYEGDPAGTR